MAMLSNDGFDITVAPKFLDYTYDLWSIRIKTHILSIDFNLWGGIEYAYTIPTKDISKWSKNDHRKFAMNN